jgi:aminoglycoside 6'-N-acetyltransferase I
MQIFDVASVDAILIDQIAAVLVDGFREFAPEAWPDLASARAEVEASLQPKHISRVALNGQGKVLGWVGAISTYAVAWELHPLVVAPAFQGQGVGQALVSDLEAQVAAQGAMTLYLGTDDMDRRTSLGGVELYPDVTAHAASIRNLRRHPFGFYQRAGFVVVGLIPDANGFGKPDIIMAKRVSN